MSAIAIERRARALRSPHHTCLDLRSMFMPRRLGQQMALIAATSASLKGRSGRPPVHRSRSSSRIDSSMCPAYERLREVVCKPRSRPAACAGRRVLLPVISTPLLAQRSQRFSLAAAADDGASGPSSAAPRQGPRLPCRVGGHSSGRPPAPSTPRRQPSPARSSMPNAFSPPWTGSALIQCPRKLGAL